ncbi:MAG: DEAD/DEAH box helicase [Candidatus Geothermincolia bacterium]
MDYLEFLEALRGEPDYEGEIVHSRILPPREPRFVELEPAPAPAVAAALARAGISSFYPHQAEAIELIRDGRHVVISSGTASGKTLTYNTPVLEAIAADKAARALYLFPTKALAQDQLRVLRELAPGFARASAYDGDTPGDMRNWIRRRANIVLSNPDMLHIGILPNHKLWGDFLKNLRHVVLDEAHVERGIFGSHVGMVLRRLRRLCSLYGSDPVFILTTATIGNPEEHARALTGLEVVPVLKDYSGSGEKVFVLWNPPFAEGKDVRRSPNLEVSQLMARLMRLGVRSIAFSRSRKASELILTYVPRALADEPGLAAGIASYRGGYLPEQRRRIERRLFEGDLLAVTATNALELGIDVGTLDACLLNGYPGTVSSTWQQAGRSGRRQASSLAVFVAHDDPLDQYFMKHPEEFFAKPVEEAIIDFENPYVMEGHLACAAYEWPLTERDASFFGESMLATAERMVESGTLERGRKGRFVAAVESPAATIGIRSASGDLYRIIDVGTGSMLGTVEEARAFFHVHPGAVYLHQGEPYEVRELDRERKVALVTEAEGDFYTQPRDSTDIKVLRQERSRPLAPSAELHYGEVEVTTLVYAYQRKRLYTHEALDLVELELPPQTLRTRALWYALDAGRLEALELDPYTLSGALHAAEHAAIGILPLFAMCDRWDIGGVSTALHPDTGTATIFIYDGYPGGAGIAARGYDRAEQHLAATLRSVRDCPCGAGCPSCIQSPKCGSGNEPLNKAAAILILDRLLLA